MSGFLGGFRQLFNQANSTVGARNSMFDLAKMANEDIQAGNALTENTVALQQMVNNYDQVVLERENQLNRYIQSSGAAQGNAARLKAGSTGLWGVNNGAMGSIISAYSNIDPSMGFIADAVFGGTSYSGSADDYRGDNKALKIQRSMDRAVQEKFMKSTIKSGNEALENVNKQSGVLADNLNGTAIGNQNKYYAAQSAIQDSGIEDSRNMARNLDYIKSRDKADIQLQYDMIYGQAEDVGRGMAASFDQLVQRQEQASLSTLINPVQFDMAGAINAGNELFMNQPTALDFDNAILSALPKSKKAGAA
jgi:hypothetical protein